MSKCHLMGIACQARKAAFFLLHSIPWLGITLHIPTEWDPLYKTLCFRPLGLFILEEWSELRH